MNPCAVVRFRRGSLAAGLMSVDEPEFSPVISPVTIPASSRFHVT